MLGDDQGLLIEQDAADVMQMLLSMLRRWQRKDTAPPL
jgi:hypothetical protein